MKDSLSYIAEREKVEEALLQSEQKYRELANSLPTCIFEADLDGRITFANRTAFDWFGYSEVDLLEGKNLMQMLAEEDRQRAEERFRRALSAGEASSGEYTAMRKDGRTFSALVTTRAMLKDGRPIGLLGILVDITERKRAEEEQRQQDKKFRAFVETTNEWIWSIDREGKHTFCNPALESILGYSPEEFVGKDSLAYICDEDRPKVQEMLKEKNSKKEGWSGLVLRWRHKDGSFRFLESTAVPILDQEGELIGYQGADRDITDRKRAEEALRESEGKFRNLAEQSPNMIFINKRGRVVYANEKSEKILGYKREEFYSPEFDFLQLHALESRDAIKASFSRHLKREEVLPIEITLLTKDGKRIEAILATKLIDYGEEKAILGIVTDITERKQAEENLRQSMIQLRTTLKAAINSLASAIEMRDPYTAGHQERVTKLASAIAREMGLSEDQIECIQVAGIIHDIGKIYVPAEILSKPGKLNEFEFMIIKTHSEVGYKILSKIEFPWPIADIVHQHHERVNGSGYPQRLTGKDILLEAKILGVADVVEAMSSHRPYRPALGIPVALEEISRNKRVLYDPKVVGACLKLFAENKFKFE
jgi:PAS domain S-box-containing protein/putative nucleotidyltransferase with HDIG domain